MMNSIVLFQSVLLRSAALQDLGVMLFFAGPVVAVVGLVILIVGLVNDNKKQKKTGLTTMLVGFLTAIGGFSLCTANL